MEVRNGFVGTRRVDGPARVKLSMIQDARTSFIFPRGIDVEKIDCIAQVVLIEKSKDAGLTGHAVRLEGDKCQGKRMVR